MQDQDIAIENAPWWLNHSHVILKGLYLAEDEAWVANNMASVQNVGKPDASVTMKAGDQTILKVQRMVKSGVVAIMTRKGKKEEVQLPLEAGKLTSYDLAYISAQIDLESKPMSLEEQKAFLASVNGHLETNLTAVK